MNNEKREFRLIHNYDTPVLIQTIINGKSCYAIIDTGSQMSYIDKNLIDDKIEIVGRQKIDIASWNATKSLELQNCKVRIVLIDNKKQNCLFDVMCSTMDMGNLQEAFAEKDYDNVSLILGADWLKINKMTINVKEKCMYSNS